MTVLKAFDLYILNFIYNNLHNYLMDRLMVAATSLGNMGLIWIIISAVLICIPKYRKVGILTISAVILSSFIGECLLKHLINRPRPFVDVPAVKMLIEKPLTNSFPSDHTSAAFAAATVLSFAFKKYRKYFFTLAIIIAFSRLYLYVHYPSDIIGGIILGLISSKVVLLFSEVIKNRQGRKILKI